MLPLLLRPLRPPGRLAAWPSSCCTPPSATTLLSSWASPRLLLYSRLQPVRWSPAWQVVQQHVSKPTWQVVQQHVSKPTWQVVQQHAATVLCYGWCMMVVFVCLCSSAVLCVQCKSCDTSSP
jgi:hypothetical protein